MFFFLLFVHDFIENYQRGSHRPSRNDRVLSGSSVVVDIPTDSYSTAASAIRRADSLRIHTQRATSDGSRRDSAAVLSPAPPSSLAPRTLHAARRHKQDGPAAYASSSSLADVDGTCSKAASKRHTFGAKPLPLGSSYLYLYRERAAGPAIVL